jgi:hypothetical protein
MQDDPAGGEIDLAAPELLDLRLAVNDFLSRGQTATHPTSPVPDYLLRAVCGRHGPPSRFPVPGCLLVPGREELLAVVAAEQEREAGEIAAERIDATRR